MLQVAGIILQELFGSLRQKIDAALAQDKMRRLSQWVTVISVPVEAGVALVYPGELSQNISKHTRDPERHKRHGEP